MNKNSFWVCVDVAGEHAFKSKPIRWKENPGNLRNLELWTSSDTDEESLNLPIGTIHKLVNLDLTWESDPIEINTDTIQGSDIKSQYKIVHENLFKGNGLSQAKSILSELMKNTVLDEIEVLEIIQGRIRSLNYKLEHSIYEKEKSSHLLKDGQSYLCVDSNYKLCIREKDGDGWESVLLVFPYISISHVEIILDSDIEKLW